MNIITMRELVRLKDKSDRLKVMIKELENNSAEYFIGQSTIHGPISLYNIDDSLKKMFIESLTEEIKKINNIIRSYGVEI